jgi:hypothetical protein
LRLLNILLGHTVVFGIGVFISSACTVIYPTTAFRCSPFEPDNCPTIGGDVYQCCSDDPAALLLTEGGISSFVTPNYQGRGGEGTPLFSAGNNPLSKSGMCIKVGSVAPAFALADLNAQGCPVPCNPTWSNTDVAAVCGAGTFCCQTTELHPLDCVFDPNDGDNGCFRPVTGDDIMGVGSNDFTNWGGTAHATHQDPSGSNCEVFVGGLQGTGVLTGSLTPQLVLNECYKRLTVSNQRGFCIGGPGVAGCPLAQPAYRDACEQQNDANFLTGCG